MKKMLCIALSLMSAVISADMLGGLIQYSRYKDAGVQKPNTSSQNPEDYKKYGTSITEPYSASTSQYTSPYLSGVSY